MGVAVLGGGGHTFQDMGGTVLGVEGGHTFRDMGGALVGGHKISR